MYEWNKIVENKLSRNKTQEDTLRTAELDSMLDMETLIKETSADPDHIKIQIGIEENTTREKPKTTGQ